MKKTQSHKIDMTEGAIRPHLIHYAIPLVLGNVFQLTYNMVDSIIAGRFIGREALAAEGIASPVMNIIILGTSGISMGAGVLMSEFFGAKDYKNLKREMSTVAVFGFIFSLFIAILGSLFTVPILRAIHVPEELIDTAAIYMSIIFMGTPFTYFYNALSSALKSIGDSQTPLKFLMFASILNGGLDIILIGGLGFGIVCSATTTVIAEAVSAVLSILYIYRNVPELKLGAREFVIDAGLLKRTLQYGSVTALQQSVQPIGKLLIQGTVNSLGVDVIAAFNAVTRVDDFAFTPEQSISYAITTFTAQNRGAAMSKAATVQTSDVDKAASFSAQASDTDTTARVSANASDTDKPAQASANASDTDKAASISANASDADKAARVSANASDLKASAADTSDLSRIKKGFATGLRLEFCYWICICIITLLLRKPIMQIFVTGEGSEAIIAIGCQYLGNMAFFYLLPAFTNGVQGFFRGMGQMHTTLLCTFIQTSIRVIFTRLLAPHMGIYGITFACAAGWIVMLLYEFPHYFRYMKKLAK